MLRTYRETARKFVIAKREEDSSYYLRRPDCVGWEKCSSFDRAIKTMDRYLPTIKSEDIEDVCRTLNIP